MRARLLAALLLTLAGLSVAPAPAYACSCAYTEHDPELVRHAEVIFTGTVVGDRTFGQTGTDADRPGALSATLCGGSRSEQAPAGLGGGYPPRPGSATSDLTWLPLAGGLAVIATAAGVDVLLRRRRPA